MSTRVIELPINGGQNEGADRTLLEPGELRQLFDGRLTRDGRVEVRPGYTSLGRASVGTTDGRFYAYDVNQFRDQLLAYGTPDSISFTPTYPRALFTYIGSQGWAPQVASALDQLPYVQDLEVVFQAPYGNVMSNSDIAYANGYLCVTTCDVGAATNSVYIMNATTGVIVKQQRNTSMVSARCCAVGNTFIIVVRTSAGDLFGERFDTTDIDGGFVGLTSLVTAELGNTNGWDLAPLGGTSDFLISFNRSAANAMRLRRLDTSFVTVNTADVSTKSGNSAVIGDTTNGVLWAIVDGNDVELRTLSTALAVTVGPTDVLGPSSAGPTGNAIGTPALAFTGPITNRAVVQIQNSGTLGIDNMAFVAVSTATHTIVASETAENVRVSSKLYTQEAGAQTSLGIGLGTMIVGGNTSGTDQVYASCIQSIDDSNYCGARWNYGIADKLDSASSSSSSHGRSSIATDGSRMFFGCVAVLDEGSIGTAARGTLQVVRWRSGAALRRQSAEMQGALYVAGGFAYYYDRGTVPVESGFLDTPVIASVTQGTVGSLTLLGTYSYVAVYEWQDAQGRIHRSTPSVPFAVTMTGANDSNSVLVSSPRSLRRSARFSDGNAVKIVVYRANPDDSVFFRVAEGTAAAAASYADTVAVVDTVSDATSQTRPVLYTQSQKPIANVAMQPCRFLAAGRDRMIFGGLPDPYMVQLSQLAFPGEPIENASPNNFAFQARLPEPVTGVACPGDSYVAFTTGGIYEIPGEGPQRNGNGEFFTPRAIFSDGGCIDWRSIVETARGTFFQLDTDKIFLLGLDGSCTWVGQPVRDTLTDYPTIVGATLCSATQRVVFACTNVAGSDGVLLIFDLRRNIWSVDRVGATRAVTEYLGRLAYCGTDGLVYLENSAIAAGGTMPTLSLRYGDFRLFSALGNGDVVKVGLLVTYLGDSTVEGFISYDDGKTWTSMGSFAVTTANTALGNPVSGSALASGDPVPLVFTPKKRGVDRFALRFDVTNATDTGACRLHTLSLELQADEFTSRKGAGSHR